MSIHNHHKTWIAELRHAFYDGGAMALQDVISRFFAEDAHIKMCYPYQNVQGANDLWARVYAPLLHAMPDIEKRDFIVMAGPRRNTNTDENWIGLGGNFVGTFKNSWLGIPPTQKPVFFRYHEYFRVENDKIVEMEAIWDIPQVMMQAGAWPMAPQLGVEWMCPGPAADGGIITHPFDAQRADASVQLIWDMLHDLKQGDANTPDRGLGGFWHENALWYGSTGIGSARGHAGIRDVVLKSFRRGLSDNTRHLDQGVFFGDHDLVAFTGWPSGTATHSGDGFLGLAPTGRRVTRRSLDFWRVENNQIRENWVMVDMLDLYHQLGVNVFDRMHAYLGTAGAEA